MKRNSAKHQQHTAKSQNAPQPQHAVQAQLAAQAQLSATGQMRALRSEAEDIVRKVRTAARASAFSEIELQKLLHDIQVQQVELELQNDELRQAQHALEVSRARYFDLYDLAPVGYFMLDENGLIVEANLTGANLLGVPRAVLLKQPLSRFIVGDDADSYYMHRKLLLQTGEAQGFELRLANAHNGSFPAWMETTMTRSGQDAPVCRVVVSDITELKAVQEQLQHSQRLLETAGRMAQLGGWSLKLPGNEITWSNEIRAILDFPEGTTPLLGEALALYTPASREIVSAALNRCASEGTPFDHELETLTKTGRPLHVRAIGQAIRDEKGNISGIQGAFQDITERKQSEQANASLEAQLRESQKMEAIGTLAGGIAHDFNNILGIILGNVELARKDAGANMQALISLEEIQKASHRARDLVRQILSFSRRQPTARRVLSLPDVAEESVRLLRAALPAGLRIEFSAATDTPAVMADPTQVQQVLLNLGANAAHAMEGRTGSIQIRVDGVTLDAAMARFESNLRPGRYARVAVSDTGHGMDERTQRRIFEPFFTTKPAGQGTGLGLTVAQGIMQAHAGVIIAHSEPGRGSRFELYFPCASGDVAGAAPPEEPGEASEGHGQHILYIDDDEGQVFLNKRLLERWGYKVSAYIEQREALDVLLSGKVQFNLVITDYNMPGVSGLEIARAIREAKVEVPVIMVSGYVTDALRVQARTAGVRELLSKPSDAEEFRDAIHRVLAPAEATP